jgi:hypothetical protein
MQRESRSRKGEENRGEVDIKRVAQNGEKRGCR